MSSTRPSKENKDPSPRAEMSDAIDYLTILDTPVVVPHAEAQRELTVRGVKIDFGSQRVVALLVSERGRPWWQATLTDVQTVEADQVRVASWDRLQALNYEGGRNVFGRSGGLIKAKVISEKGTYAGRINTFWFRLVGGDVTEYVMSRGILRDFFRGRCIVTRDEVASASPEKIVTLSEKPL